MDISYFHWIKEPLKFVAMKLLTLFLILASTGSVLAQKDVSAAIQQANDKWGKFFSDNDAAGVASLYTADARLLPPNHPVVTGKENIKAFWESLMQEGIRADVTTITALANGSTAVEEGMVKIYAGDAMVDEVKYIVIWKKVKGEWMIHQDIWNSSNPAPGQ